MKHFLTTCVALGLLGSPAIAQCFDETVLSRGLTIRYDNGDFTTIRRAADGYQVIDEFYDEGSSTMRFRAHRGGLFRRGIRTRCRWNAD